MSIVKYWFVCVLSCSALRRALSRVNPDISANSSVVENLCVVVVCRAKNPGDGVAQN